MFLSTTLLFNLVSFLNLVH